MEIIEIPKHSTPNLFDFAKTNRASQLSAPIPSLPTFSQSLIHENIQNSEILIRKWDPNNSSMQGFISLFQESRKEAKEFIKCIENLRKAMHFLISEHSSSSKLVLAQKLMKIAMQRLEKEFFQILSANKEHLNSESVSSHSSLLSRSLSLGNSEDEDEYIGSNFDDLPTKADIAMSDLKLIADTMINSGYSSECLKIFKITRKSILDEELYRLGIKTFSASQITSLNSKSLEQIIDKWINAAKISVQTQFYRERILCDHVFESSETIKQTCFAHITMDGALKLFKFPEIVTKIKRSPEKIFSQINLYETISDLWTEIESIFSYEQLSPVRLQALSSLHKLSASVQTILSEFISSIQKNSSKTVTPGGGIHPLTNSVMNYIIPLANSSGVLAEILTDDQDSLTKSPFPESYFNGSNSSSSLASRLAWIILVLLCKLDSKAELYNDIALSYLFLANNLELVVEKVNTTPLKLLLGEDWVISLQNKVQLYAANYESAAWNKTLSCLPEENLTRELSPDFIQKCFRQFYSVFEEAYRKQSSWIIPDSNLRDKIKMSIARKLVPAYREFYDSYLGILNKEKNFEVLVRFSPDNLGNYLSDLFHKPEEDFVSSSSPIYRRTLCL